jgi:hypothetical protein
MSLRKRFHVPALIAAGFLMLVSTDVGTQRAQAASLKVGKMDIGGVVTSSKGPEAGVWVIAQTKDTPTPFTRIVVTDDQGQYLVPDLPQGSYHVWVRGYGLLDSKAQPANLGQKVDLKAEVAPDAKSAALVYPAAWWASLMKLPDDLSVQRKMAIDFKECYDCHQVGNKITRELGNTSSTAGATSTLDAWDRRTKVGPVGVRMAGAFQEFGKERNVFADWSDRIAHGEVPQTAPQRPVGLERNLVISEWDWGMPNAGRADAAASDTRNPRVNANGPIFEASEHTDMLTILDPVQNKASMIRVPSEAPRLTDSLNTVSPYAGPDAWHRSADPRSVGIDGKGRVWVTDHTRENTKQPAFCTSDSNKFGAFYPLKQSNKQEAIYDQKTKEWQVVDTCFNVDHNQIGDDNFIYFGIGSGIGWIDINTWDKTHNAEASQGWCPGVMDTNGDGKISKGWTEPNDPVDPARDHRIQFGAYSTAINPNDGSLWIIGIGRGDKRLVRISKGSNPPESCLTEFFEPPPGQEIEIFGSGGVEVDHNGLVWVDWRDSGHFTAFDRSKCKTTKDPQATGQSCPEGWTVYRYTNVPTYQNSKLNPAAGYLTHMDYHDILGLGKDTPLYGSTNLDAFVAFDQKTKQFVTLRIPYPMGFMPRAASGRVDDPKTGWKGKGMWSDYASFAGWHIEGNYGTLPKAVKFQMRPNPLAD